MNSIKIVLINEINQINKQIANKSRKEIKIDYPNFKNWIDHFLLADLSFNDKFELLQYARQTFIEFKRHCDDENYMAFFELIVSNRIIDAVKLSEYLSNTYDEKRNHVKQLVKQRSIYILSPRLDIEMAGLSHIVLQRANYLAEHGYDVTLLNAGPIKNYNYIQDYYKKQNRFSDKVKFHNYIEYFSFKNSNGTKNPTLDEEIKQSNDKFITKENLKIEKIITKDNCITLNYLNPGESIVKTETYIDDCLIFKQENDFEYYYTPDGFNYLEVDINNHTFYLHERDGLSFTFTYRNQFLNHFLSEICLGNQKPFIICDSTHQWYNMNGIRLKDAFKIGCLHGNPFIDFDPEKGVSPRINHLQKLETFNKIVLLTDTIKKELLDYVDGSYLTVIPNFVDDKFLKTETFNKDLDKIAVFSRISSVKNIPDMIQAFKMISDTHKNVHLDIYGTTSTAAEEEELIHLQNMIKDYNLEDRIHFKGYIDDVHSEMKKTFFTISTSKQEGLSVSTLELMANATPIITYDIRYGPKDIITDGVDGILLEEGDVIGLGNAMLKFLNNPEKTLEMGLKAKEKIKNKFSRSYVCNMWEELFIDIFIENELKDQINNLTYDKKVNELENKYNELLKDNEDIMDENNNLKKEIENLNKFKQDVLSSYSWKITSPIRKIKR